MVLITCRCNKNERTKKKRKYIMAKERLDEIREQSSNKLERNRELERKEEKEEQRQTKLEKTGEKL
jgi:hypothetical protein